RSWAVGLAVPTSIQRYTIRESAETTSAPRLPASARERAVFPVAVGPTRARTAGSPPGRRMGHAAFHRGDLHDRRGDGLRSAAPPPAPEAPPGPPAGRGDRRCCLAGPRGGRGRRGRGRLDGRGQRGPRPGGRLPRLRPGRPWKAARISGGGRG